LKSAKEMGTFSKERLMSRAEELCAVEIKLDRTFESQYNDCQTLRFYRRSDNTSAVNEYVLAPQHVTDSIDLQERQIEYNDFIEKELNRTYPAENDGSLEYIRGIFIKNKAFIRDNTTLLKTLMSAKTLAENKKTSMLNENMLSHLKELIEYLEHQSTEYKCCICTENWKNCLLPTCMHMTMCQACVMKNREYGRFTCPLCRVLNPFYIIDFDIASK
jgi:hypothetical protein